MVWIGRTVPSLLTELRLISSPGKVKPSFGICSNSVSKRSVANAPLEGFDLGEVIAEPQNDIRVQKTRDISRLKQPDWNELHGKKRHDEDKYPQHFTIRYKRGVFGRYGSASNINPGICWPTEEGIEDRLEWERVTYPYSIMDVVKEHTTTMATREQLKWELDDRVAQNIANMNKHLAGVEKKLKEEKEATKAAQERRKRLIAEVHEHFNYSINERDERFKVELLERAKKLKEKERLAKKAIKVEKKEEKKAKAAEEARQMLLKQSGQKSV